MTESRWAMPKLSGSSRAHLVISACMMLVVSAMEGAIVGVFVRNVDYYYGGALDAQNITLPATCNLQTSSTTNDAKSLTVYIVVFVLAQIFQFLVVVDALWQQNTMQVIMHDVLAVMMLAYSVVQYFQLKDLLNPCSLNVQFLTDSGLDFANAACNPGCQLFTMLTPFIATNIAVLGVSLLIFAYLTKNLYLEYGWSIIKKVGANESTISMFRDWEINQMLLKADFFFFETFSIQYLYLVLLPTDPEYGLTIAAMLLAVPIAYLGWWAIAHENKIAVAGWITVLIGISAYYAFKIAKIYLVPAKYIGSGKFLTLFAVLGLAVTIAQLVYTAICISHFGRGLKAFLVGDKTAEAPARAAVPMDVL